MMRRLFSLFTFHFSLVCLVLFSSCGNHSAQISYFNLNPQDTIKRIFDIEKFNENKVIDFIYEYYTYFENDTFIDQSKRDGYYLEKIYYPDSLLGDFNCYYFSGKMMSKCQFFIRGDFLVGHEIFFDEQGNVTGVDNLEEFYSFTLDDVLNYMVRENIDVSDTYLQIQINGDNLNSIPSDHYIWIICQTTPDGWHRIILDAVTGEVLMDKILKEPKCT